MVVWRSQWSCCFHCIISNTEEFSPLCAAHPDRNVEWKFHCTNWLLPIDVFTAINKSCSVLSGQLKRLNAAAFAWWVLNAWGSSCNLIRAVMVRSTSTSLWWEGTSPVGTVSHCPDVLGPRSGHHSHSSSVLWTHIDELEGKRWQWRFIQCGAANHKCVVHSVWQLYCVWKGWNIMDSCSMHFTFWVIKVMFRI